jgi:hypothetical protein
VAREANKPPQIEPRPRSRLLPARLDIRPAAVKREGGGGLGQETMAMTMDGKYRIMIYGPKEDGTYVVEFKTAAGEAMAISIETLVI